LGETHKRKRRKGEIGREKGISNGKERMRGIWQRVARRGGCVAGKKWGRNYSKKVKREERGKDSVDHFGRLSRSTGT